jgi:hypothetical protein
LDAGLRKRLMKIVSRLKLIGTVPGDPDGFRRTLRILCQIRPKLIFVELSPYGYRFRREHGTCLIHILNHHLAEAARRSALLYEDASRHPQVEAIRRQIRLPFEYRAAVLAAKMSSSRIFLVDQSAFSRKLIADWFELISPDNLFNLLNMAPEIPSTQTIYRNASQRIANSSSIFLPEFSRSDTEEKSIWREREEFMGRQILRTMAALRRGRAVYLGGWWHLTVGGNIPTLRDLLGIGLSGCLLIDRIQQFEH